jgi:hypothetical protein
MKKIFLLPLLFLFISCVNNKEKELKKENNIEFMSYSWELNRKKRVYFLECESYSIINFSGNHTSYFVEFFPNKEAIFFESRLSKKVIDSLVKKIEKMKENNRTFIEYDSSSGCIQAPPTFKLKINYVNKASKTYSFGYNELYHFKPLLNLYSELEINKAEGKYTILNDTSEIAAQKNKFISKTIHEDTITFKKPKITALIPQG